MVMISSENYREINDLLEKLHGYLDPHTSRAQVNEAFFDTLNGVNTPEAPRNLAKKLREAAEVADQLAKAIEKQ